jgi:hypothetical protein
MKFGLLCVGFGHCVAGLDVLGCWQYLAADSPAECFWLTLVLVLGWAPVLWS